MSTAAKHHCYRSLRLGHIDFLCRSSLGAKIDQLVDVLKETQTRAKINDIDRHRLKLLISGLLNQGIYHRDIMESKEYFKHCFN